MAEFDVVTMDRKDRYFLMTRVIGPRPIAWVSSLDTEGRGNLAPFSCFMMGGNNPTSCVFSVGGLSNGKSKDTLRNIRDTGEYVINLANSKYGQAVSQSSYAYEHGDDEFDYINVTRAESVKIAPPRVAEVPLALECRLHQIVTHGEGRANSNYIIGEVLYVHAQDECLGDDGLPDAFKLDQLARLGGALYAHVTPEVILEIPRPEGP